MGPRSGRVSTESKLAVHGCRGSQQPKASARLCEFGFQYTVFTLDCFTRVGLTSIEMPNKNLANLLAFIPQKLELGWVEDGHKRKENTHHLFKQYLGNDGVVGQRMVERQGSCCNCLPQLKSSSGTNQ